MILWPLLKWAKVGFFKKLIFFREIFTKKWANGQKKWANGHFWPKKWA